ncbi:MAG: type I restriction-modification system subunit M [Olsenella sp.]|jgi:type I restriction enzyme M protein|nr:type I restriction-modification system subunit M [Olsenella sp.]
MADKTAFDYVNEIWSIANYVRDVIRPADYNKLILPFAVLRRFECALEPTRAVVSRQAAKGVWDDDDPKYCALSGHCFYNVTSFTLSNLGATKTCDALMAYINGFSANAREVLQRFEMRQTCEKLDEKGMLYEVCTRFASFDLGPEAVSDRMMTDIYEHLIQRYGEEISQDAEDFMTPKDVARLATALLFANEDTLLNADNGDIRTLYDGSCGTCGFICDALDQLDEWHDKGHFSSPTKIVPYGQELEDATWAMGKAALMLRNIAGGTGDVLDQMSDLSAGIMLGDTLDDDRFDGRTFNYQLTNPPYGKEWRKEQDGVVEEAQRGFGGRFGAGLPSIDDGSMLFLQNVAAKMAPVEEGGGKAAIVLSGSPLFNGDAGSGPSNIRRWLFHEDLVDCIVKLPTEIFFRTGIATYVWVLNNHKPENRKGYVQLIDASEERTALRKSQGNKRYEIGEEQAAWIVRTYVDGHDHGKSVIVPVEDFMYRKVTTQRPLRVFVEPTPEKLDELFSFSKPMEKMTGENRATIRLWAAANEGDALTYAQLLKDVDGLFKRLENPKPQKTKLVEALVKVFGRQDPSAEPAVDAKGNPVFDPELRDSENVPLGMDIDDYMASEVLPYAPDAVVDASVIDEPRLDKKTGLTSNPLGDGGVGVVGTSISFNRYFYKYEKPRDPEVIAKEILELEDGLGELMRGFLA